jgi:hypothetical protein
VTLAVASPTAKLFGKDKPRIAPPTPAKSDVDGFREVASSLDIELMPWQVTTARYLEAIAADGRHLYREVGIVVSRQNGKTTLLLPLIVKRLLAGQRIMHTAQDRSLPREVFYLVADVMWERHANLFPSRNGRPTKPRYANGQEEIRLTNGGIYSIVAPTRGGARGPSRDLVLLDELREMDTWDFIGAAKPTMTASPDPQIVYLSNAGDETSVVLNSLRARAADDPHLAYLEWSAKPDRAADDLAGWLEADPAIGHIPTMLDYLTGEYASNKLAGTLSIFETEHLCRWVISTRERLVSEFAWSSCEVDPGPPIRPVMGVSVDPSGKRAAASIAWPKADGSIGLRLLYDVTGNPINLDKLGADLRIEARKLGVSVVGFDPMTDALLAKFFLRKEPIAGSKFANASARFVSALEAKKVQWIDSADVGHDLSWTTRKPNDEKGSFEAVRADDNRPIPAALASIRALWLASTPQREPTPKAVPAVMGF